MSKSDPSDQSRINLSDDADTIATKIRKAQTDSGLMPTIEILNEQGAITAKFWEERPNIANLLTIYHEITKEAWTELLQRFAGQNFTHFKEELTQVLIEHIRPIGQEITKVLQDTSYLESVLQQGGAKARALSAPVKESLYQKLGLWS